MRRYAIPAVPAVALLAALAGSAVGSAGTVTLQPAQRVQTPGSSRATCPLEGEPAVTVTSAGTWVAYNDDDGCPAIALDLHLTSAQLLPAGGGSPVVVTFPTPKPGEYLSGDPALTPDPKRPGNALLATLYQRSAGLSLALFTLAPDGTATELPSPTIETSSPSDDKEFIASDTSCGYWTSDDPAYTLHDAQTDKLELIARKLGVQPGGRHLDIGCGWGSLSLYLAREHKVSVIGVTISREQKAFIDARIREQGLEDLVEIRLQDYRQVPETGFDTVSSIEMGEHVGAENYPVFCSLIASRLRDGGRALIQQMSRRDRPGGGDFIEAFIAPDMHMRPVGETVALIEDAGLEVRDVHALREHYVRTIRAWADTFEANWSVAVAMVGEEVARVWRLYLVGGGLVFEEGRMGVDQILAVKRSPDGDSGMPWVRSY